MIWFFSINERLEDYVGISACLDLYNVFLELRILSHFIFFFQNIQWVSVRSLKKERKNRSQNVEPKNWPATICMRRYFHTKAKNTRADYIKEIRNLVEGKRKIRTKLVLWTINNKTLFNFRRQFMENESTEKNSVEI